MAPLPQHPLPIPPGPFLGGSAGPEEEPRPPLSLPQEQDEAVEGPPGYGPDPDYGPDDVEPEPTPPLPPEPQDGPQPRGG